VAELICNLGFQCFHILAHLAVVTCRFPNYLQELQALMLSAFIFNGV